MKDYNSYHGDVKLTDDLLEFLFAEEEAIGGAGDCHSRHPHGWVCTLNEGHGGPHIAGYGDSSGAACAWLEHDPELNVDEGL